MEGGNLFAGLMILVWPLVSIALFVKRPVNQAILCTVLGGLLLLPTYAAIKITMVPALDKSSVPSVCAFIGALVLAPRAHGRAKLGIADILVAVFLVSPLVTSLLNSDPILVGDVVGPGVGAYDGISATLSGILFFLTFFVGRRYLRTAPDIEEMFRILAFVGLVFTLPLLFEIRFSPQLANWIYHANGFGFNNEMRDGGFRPVVFMPNGLAAAFFMATAFLAAVTLLRVKMKFTRWPTFPLVAYMAAVIVACKSAGALIYTVLIGSLIGWGSPKWQMRIALVLAAIALTYPMLRLTNFFPTESLVSSAEMFSEDRARSLQFRFNQEQQLLARAMERPLFGWGRYGRSRVYSQYSGQDTSITDGWWIITLGQYGLVGFLAQFGLLVLPVYRAAKVFRLATSIQDRLFLAALGLIVSITAVEQLPNASVSSWTWLLVGALLGRTEDLRLQAKRSSMRMAPKFGLERSSVSNPSANPLVAMDIGSRA